MNTDPLTVEVVTVADLCVGDLWRKSYGDTAFREILSVRREHGCGVTYAVIEYSTATGRGEGRFKLDLPAERRYVEPESEPQVGDAAWEVDGAMRGRLDDLALLQRIVECDADEFSNDQILSVGVGYGIAGPLSADQMREEAEDRLNALPLAVEAMTTFEIVLGVGGPDDRLCFECSGDVEEGFEIDRVLYRYSWTGSAERVLSGEDRKTAEALARRVVPELAE